jgi:hypothetical protein
MHAGAARGEIGPRAISVAARLNDSPAKRIAMPLTQSGSERGRYLVHAVDDAVPLTAFLDAIASNPAIAIVEHIGPAERPHTVVAEMSHDQARALEQQFRQNQQPITIEPDQTLSLFGASPVQKGL